MKKYDIILLVIIVLVSLFFFVPSISTLSNGDKAVVYVERQLYKEYNLNIDIKESIIGKDGIELIIEIKNQAIRVKEAECPDKVCVKTSFISKAGQSIICLPAQIVISIEAASSGDYDTISS